MTSNARPQALQALLDAVQLGFQHGSPGHETRACLQRVFDALQYPVAATGAQPAYAAVGALLEQAVKPARRAGGGLKNLADRILELDPLLPWRSRPGSAPDAGAPKPDVPANAMIVGPNGIEDRKDVWVGLSLLAPGVRYPDHRHAPEEVYLVLTDGRFMQGERGWFTPGVGGSLYNAPNTLHAMAAPPDGPLLALWCLFDTRYPRTHH